MKNPRKDKIGCIEKDFISIASHELRNPLTIIKGAVWLVKEGDLGKVNDEQCNMLERADEQVNRLTDIISKLQYISEIDTGDIELFNEKISLFELAKKVIKENEFLASLKDLKVDIESPDDLPYVVADAQKIHDVLANLLSNAIKFSYMGGRIKIRISKKNDKIVTEVMDNGEGVPKRLLPKLFNKFITTDLRSPKRGGGIGLGLAVAKGFIEAQGGDIWAQSKGTDKGSKFIFTLPIHKDTSGK